MGQLIDFWSVREMRPQMPVEAKRRCSNCGADLWHINRSGEICCADCYEPSSWRLPVMNDNQGRETHG